MTIQINRMLCNGCGNVPEPRCMIVCPGDLLVRDEEHKCRIRDPRDCWDCAACVKECPREAIEMVLPVQLGGRGATLRARTGKGLVTWYLTNPDGESEIYRIETKKVAEE